MYTISIAKSRLVALPEKWFWAHFDLYGNRVSQDLATRGGQFLDSWKFACQYFPLNLGSGELQ
jgi:hypothetical protein